MLSIKQMSMHLIFDMLILAFFSLGKYAVCYPKLCLFVSGLYSEIQESSSVITFFRKSRPYSMHSVISMHTSYLFLLLNR